MVFKWQCYYRLKALGAQRITVQCSKNNVRPPLGVSSISAALNRKIFSKRHGAYWRIYGTFTNIIRNTYLEQFYIPTSSRWSTTFDTILSPTTHSYSWWDNSYVIWLCSGEYTWPVCRCWVHLLRTRGILSREKLALKAKQEATYSLLRNLTKWFIMADFQRLEYGIVAKIL